METCSRAPSCDHFGCNGKWKLYLATKILKKVASWWPTDQLKKVRFEKIFGSKSGGGGGGGFMGWVKIFYGKYFFNWKSLKGNFLKKWTWSPVQYPPLSPPIKFAPTSYHVHPHTFWVRPHQVESAPWLSDIQMSWFVSWWVNSSVLIS